MIGQARRGIRLAVLLLSITGLAAWIGCGKSNEPTPTSMKERTKPGGVRQVPQGTATKTEETGAAKPAPKPEPPPPLTIPKVALSEKLLEASVVKVGDTMPEGELPDLSGKVQLIRSLQGKNLTVVFFWTAAGSLESEQGLYASQALRDLQGDVVKPYGDRGVAAVAVNEKDAADLVRTAVKDAGAEYPNLRDSAGTYLARVATAKLPRIYLLDSAGKILWFDVQYANSTRRDLLIAIQVALGEKK